MGSLECWAKDEAAHVAWEQFLKTPAGKDGLAALAATQVPTARIGEPNEAAAQRQYQQSGFHHCLYLMANIDKVGKKHERPVVPDGWGLQPLLRED